MQRLNYHHLMYFWRIAREGGLVPAGKILRLSPQTLSGQVRAFEEVVGQKLFVRRGRRLALTDAGRIAFQYADDIFSLGAELEDILHRGALHRPQRLEVGLVEALPKMFAQALLEPLTKSDPPVVVACREGTLTDLSAKLAAHTIDVVLADEPLPHGASIRAFNHLLGETSVTFFASPALELPSTRFPAVLDGVPFLMPFAGSPLRRQLDAYFARHHVTPHIVAEIEDSALVKNFGRMALGVFCAPSIVATAISTMFDVRPIGATDEIVERFYAISAERRVKHPSIAFMLETSHELFT